MILQGRFLVNASSRRGRECDLRLLDAGSLLSAMSFASGFSLKAKAQPFLEISLVQF